MKTLGLIGGMSWESTLPYYRIVNETVRARLGGLHSARLLLYSVDFHDIERLQQAGDWNAAGERMAEAARSLQAAGAELLVLCTNTMHKVAPAIEADRAAVHRVIYDELCQGRIEPASREVYRRVMARLVDAGAEAIVLGCTEITLLVDAGDAAVPLFDTTRLHAEAAALAALGLHR